MTNLCVIVFENHLTITKFSNFKKKVFSQYADLILFQFIKKTPFFKVNF